MFYDVKPEDVIAIARWLDDENAEMPSDDALKSFMNMSDAVRRRLWSDLKKERRRCNALERRLGRFSDKEQKQWEGGEFDSLGYDSVEIAYAIAYVFRERNLRYSMGHLQQMMYLVYASWLYHHKERICVEHPVRQEQGPWFWKVSKKAAVFANPEGWWWNNVAGKNPGLATVIRRVVAKWGDEREDNLRRELLKTVPMRNTERRKNNGKWNMEINDGDIFLWKQSIMNNK